MHILLIACRVKMSQIKLQSVRIKVGYTTTNFFIVHLWKGSIYNIINVGEKL